MSNRMSTSSKQIVRMGPISILSMLIVLSLATMAVLSFTTARAAQRTADKQAQAIQALYACETAGQDFVAQVDNLLADQRKASAEQAAQALRKATDAEGTGPLVTKTFVEQGHELVVSVRVQGSSAAEKSYEIVGWRIQAKIDSQEETLLWQG